MLFNRNHLCRAVCAIFIAAGTVLAGNNLITPAAYAQTAVTGALTGVVTDSSGAVIPGVTVTITDTATGAKRVLKTNADGRYTAPLLKPATYLVTTQHAGLSASPVRIQVLVGQNAVANITMSAGKVSQTVTVSAETGQLIDTQSTSLVTTYTEKQVQSLPAPGGDITTVAYTTPGVTVNAGGSYGNFSADGLPGISNRYIINGFDDEDPFLNLNNSGSSNLTLGQGEIAEASVVLNGYSAQYGRAAGAIINYTTKSGTDQFHGMANYYYNGDVLNANDWFRNYSGIGRSRAISNEWAANIGGPIIRHKLFFFADYEGLRYVLPATGYAVFPTPQFESYALSHVPNGALPFYKQAFNLYNSAPEYKTAVPVTTGSGLLQDSTGNLGCGGFAGTPTGNGGTFGVDTPCELAAVGSASNINKEWLFTTRIDWHISDKQQLFGRFKVDHGTQPTYTNFVSPVFNTVSSQPEYEGQLNDTYTFNPNLINQFIMAGNWYTAYFGPANQKQTIATFPTYLLFYDGSINSGATFGSLGTPYYFPQGRNVTNYQFVDDLSWVKGNNTFRFGFNFLRDDISDYDNQILENGAYLFFSLADFANGTNTGVNSEYLQNVATQPTSYLALYNLGVYAQDEWQINPRLKLTLGLRVDRTGNPLCNNNCFARYIGSFPQPNTSNSVAYNKLIAGNQAHPFPSIESGTYQPRFGFNYDVNGNGKNVVRGGIGLFADLWPGSLLDSFTGNFPQLYAATVLGGDVGSPSDTNSSMYYADQSAQIAEAGYKSGASYNDISSQLGQINVPFSAPNLYLSQHNWRGPKYIEWSLQVQHKLDRTDALILSYAGNEGYDEIIQNQGVNAANANSSFDFGGLPANQPDPNFYTTTAYLNEANSNYNGLSITWKHIDHRLTTDFTYTYSHALDDVSNGGVGEVYNSTSVQNVLNPSNIASLNYSNADYDIRNNFVADYTYQLPDLHAKNFFLREALGGWLFAGKTFWRSGEPFSVINSGLNQADTAGTAGGSILAALAPGANPSRHCNGNGINTPCFTTADFQTTANQTTFGNIKRNSFYGPRYADSDFALSKRFVHYKSMNFSLGTYAFNVFNHPNFSQPSNDVGAGNVGTSGSILAPPTSPYGSFQGAGVGGRVLQVFGKFTF
ncbi:MAG: carboxypeptidase regulatory-like domain-containing protein [Acidobacteriaceae bacterium]